MLGISWHLWPFLSGDIDLNLLLLGLWHTPESAYINVAVYLKEVALEGTIQVWIYLKEVALKGTIQVWISEDVKSSVHIHKSVEPKSR